MPCPVEFEEISPAGKQWPTGDLTCIRKDAKELSYPLKRDWKKMDSLPDYYGKRITWGQVRENPNLLDNFVAQMSVDELQD